MSSSVRKRGRSPRQKKHCAALSVSRSEIAFGQGAGRSIAKKKQTLVCFFALLETVDEFVEQGEDFRDG